MNSILALPPEELAEAFARDGVERYRAGQVTRWVWQRGERDFAGMTDLGKALRTRLAGQWSTRALRLAAVERSRDGTRKLALRTERARSSRR